MNPVAYELWGQHAHYEFEPEYENLCKSLERGAREIERLQEAADEVERLRQDVQDATDIIAKTLVMSGREIEALKAECERLRNQLNAAHGTLGDVPDGYVGGVPYWKGPSKSE